jgi:hypothetical protein
MIFTITHKDYTYEIELYNGVLPHNQFLEITTYQNYNKVLLMSKIRHLNEGKIIWKEIDSADEVINLYGKEYFPHQEIQKIVDKVLKLKAFL